MANQTNRNTYLKVGSILAIIVLWEVLIGYFRLIPLYLLPPPSNIVETLATLLGQETFLDHIQVTVYRVVVGSIAGSVIGVILGLAIGWSRKVELIVFPLVSATYPIPVIALLPLFMLFFGDGDTAYLVLISIAGMFTMLFHAMHGIDNIDNIYFDVAKDYGVDSNYRYFREVLVPGAIPSIYTGLRLTLSTVLLVTIAIEFIAASDGLGLFIWNAWGNLQTIRMYAAIVLVGLAGVLITYGLEFAGDRMMPWKADTTGGVR